MKKRLIFNFYIDENWKENHMNKIHLYCLKHYRDVFNEMIFMVSLNDTENKELIYDFENHILSLELCPNIQFIIKKNHVFREAKNFYEEIALKLRYLDGLTFFGHNKGITNYFNPDFNKKDVEKWVTSMYYGCLCDVKEMELYLTDCRKLAYGTLLDEISINGVENAEWNNSLSVWLGERRYFYMGTFFWLNCNMIDYYLQNSNTDIPKLVDRWYAENFFANIFDSFHCSSFNDNRTLNYVQGGCKNIDAIINLSFREKIGEYNDFHNNVINAINYDRD